MKEKFVKPVIILFVFLHCTYTVERFKLFHFFIQILNLFTKKNSLKQY